jgi:hypothetical protein
MSELQVNLLLGCMALLAGLGAYRIAKLAHRLLRKFGAGWAWAGGFVSFILGFIGLGAPMVFLLGLTFSR